jgi:hypothetical protein
MSAVNLKSKRHEKPKTALLDRLSKPLQDFVADFETHGKATLEKVRETNPEKYLELATRLAQLVTALKPASDGFESCNSREEIARKLLQSVKVPDDEITDDMVAQAIALNEKYYDDLWAVYQCATASEEGPMQ